MTELSVREVYQTWDWDKDGTISKDDLVQALEDVAVEAVDAVFDQMDAQALGYVGYDEFANWLFCHAPLQEKLLQECACSDGHGLNAFRPDVDGWCCEECSVDLDVGSLALQCQECGGMSFCIECTLQQSEVEAVERIAMAAVSAIAESQDTVETSCPSDSIGTENAASPDDDHSTSEPDEMDLVTEELDSEAHKEGPVKLFIVGLAGDLCSIDADYGWTVLQLKSAIESEINIPGLGCSLTYDLVALQDDTVLGSAKLPNDAEVMLLRRSEQQVEWLQKIHKTKSQCEKSLNNALPSLLRSAPAEMCDDRLIVLEAVSLNAMDLEYASRDLQADKGIVFAAAKKNPNALRFASPLLLADYNVGLELVKSNGMLLWALAEKLRADPEVVLAAVNDNGKALVYAADEVLEHPAVLDLAFERGFCLRKIYPRRLNDHIDVVRAAARRDRWSIKYASERIRSDRKMLMWLLLDDPWHLRWVPWELLADQALLAIAFEKDAAFTLLDAPEKLRAHPDVVYRVVQQNGAELRHAAQKLRSNRSIVSAAVKNCGMALQYASFPLRNDRAIVELAARQDSRAMRFAGANLKDAPARSCH